MTSFYLRYDKHHLSYDFYDDNIRIIETNMRFGTGQVADVLNDWLGKDNWDALEMESNTETIHYKIRMKE